MTSERDLKLPLLSVQALMPEFDLYLTVVPLGFFASYSLRAKLSIVELKKAYNKFRLEVELFIVVRRRHLSKALWNRFPRRQHYRKDGLKNNSSCNTVSQGISNFVVY